MVLFPRHEAGQRIRFLPLEQIRPNPNQPRRNFDPQALELLADSIRALGILQPLTVRRTANGWELVAGERRLRAAALAGLDRVPCITTKTDGQSSSLLTLTENVHRKNLDFVEELWALDNLMRSFCLSQDDVARQLGVPRSVVTAKLRLLRLPTNVLHALRDSGLTEQHAYALLPLEQDPRLEAATRHVIRGRYSPSHTERYVATLLATDAARMPSQPRSVKDVRLFLKGIVHRLSMMQVAGVEARCQQQETDESFCLTIHISK